MSARLIVKLAVSRASNPPQSRGQEIEVGVPEASRMLAAGQIEAPSEDVLAAIRAHRLAGAAGADEKPRRGRKGAKETATQAGAPETAAATAPEGGADQAAGA